MRNRIHGPRHYRWSGMSALIVVALSLLLLMTPLSQMRTTAQSGDERAARLSEEMQEYVQEEAGATRGAREEQDAPEVETLLARGRDRQASVADAPAFALDNERTNTSILRETEPNDAAATAQPLNGSSVRVRGDLYQFPVPVSGDVDVYSFYAGAGDRVYASVMTSFSGGGADTQIDILSTDGSTVLENDNDDGSFGALSSAVAGTTMPVTGTYYVRVRPQALTLVGTVRPYDLYLKVQSGAPVAEVEPNGVGTPDALPPSGWVSGAIATSGDVDTYSFTANAGDTIVLMLDADPERDGPGVAFWNPAAFIGIFSNTYLGVNDTSTTSATDPNAEAAYMTVKNTGTYEVLVQTGTPGTFGPTFTYHLSVTVIPGNGRRCTSYAGTGGTINDLTTTDFALNVPDNKVISTVQVSMSVTHLFVSDLDVSLVDPQGDEVVIFDNPPNTGGAPAPQIDFVIDDEAAFPVAAFAIHRGMHYTPEFFARLNWFKGQPSVGTWTLRFRDDFSGDTGTLNSWSINICEEPALRNSPASASVFSTDFETDDAGFTHSGTADEWARGLPSGGSAPITTCHSGSNCWKTDLTGTYNASSNQDLLSPNINLATFAGRHITLQWWQKYQLDSASNDTAFVEVREVGNPSNFRRVWEWKGADMTRAVGNPAATVNAAAGWGLMESDISDFGGKTVEVRFHLESNAGATNRSGLAVDDFNVSYNIAAFRADFDNDSQTDVSVWRPSDGNWTIRRSSDSSILSLNWGAGALGDIVVPGNYGGLIQKDVAVWRPSEGNWYVVPDGTGTPFAFGWGGPGDDPVPGDYDGDAFTDYAVFRPSEGNWYIKSNPNGSFGGAVTVRNWGATTDQLVPADYDGDGATDIAVFRPSEGNWYIIESFTGFVRVVNWGDGSDQPVPVDYDGDRKADIAVWRPSDGVWYIIGSSDGRQIIRNWGSGSLGDIPVPGKYDSDHKHDIAVWRESEANWYIINSATNTVTVLNLGATGDVPVPSAHVPQ